MSEYGEPWWPWSDSNGVEYILGADGHTVVSLTGNGISDSDTRRIVACVNAMEGIPKPEAYRKCAGELAAAVRHWINAPGGLQGCWNFDFVEAALIELESLSAPSTGAQQ